MKQKIPIRVGGQALIEGIMMRKQNTVSMAVRLPNKEIDIETFRIKFLDKINWYKNIPILRGIIEMIVSFSVGYKCLLKSIQKATIEENKPKNSNSSNKIIGLVGFFSSIIGVLFSIAVFMFFPSVLVKNFSNVVYFNNSFKVLIEGLIKILIFIIYIFLISKMQDIKKTFEYHGAEHKTIFCFEAGLDLNIENVKKQKRFHPRCGTNFIFVVLIVSILVFSFITWENLFERLFFKFLMLPLITGISYEIIRLSGKSENIITKILILPGLLLQRVTTKEPNEQQIEVAIEALKEALKN